MGITKQAGSIRELALDMLMEIEAGKEFSHVLIRNVLEKYDYLETRDKAFLKRVVEGSLERQIELDYLINSVSSLPVKKMKPLIRCLLRMSVYQILFMDAVPERAAVSEALKLAQRRKFSSLKGFLNGVLRAICRQKGNFSYPKKETHRLSYLSVAYSMPEWIVEKWEREQGEEVTEKILQGLFSERGVTLRFQEQITEEEMQEIQKALAAKGGSLIPAGLLPYAYVLTCEGGPGVFPPFLKGLCTVQDVSSMLAVEAAGIKSGDFVLDVCAAPGGKAVFAAEKALPEGSVLARDLTEHKTEYIAENKERMRTGNLTVQTWDATIPDEALFEKADVVLVDAPCSGLGVIAKKRDIKYRATREGLLELVSLQKKILETVQQYVKPGGILLYSTCTINRQENEEVAAWFLQEFPFRPGEIAPVLPKQLWKEDSGNTGRDKAAENKNKESGKETAYSIQLLPGIHGTDGFFMARFVKEET